MPYQSAYQLQWANVERVACKINISDTLSGEGTPTYTQLIGSGNPGRVYIIDNNETKFSPIRAKQMEIKFVSTATENLTSFISPEDNRWLVEYFVGGLLKFVGFLVLDDVDEDFLDSSTKNEVTLIATDNIGLLKDVPLVTLSGVNPRGYFRISQYIAWALAQTGLKLRINIVHNLKEERYLDVPFFYACYLHSKTFEDQINKSISCYEVLEAILSCDAELTQQDGEWWIVRVDEKSNVTTYNNRFSYTGVKEDIVEYNLNQAVFPDGQVRFSGKSTFVKVQMPVRNVNLEYEYRLPIEIIDNIDFSRSEVPFVTGAPYVDPADGVTKVEKRYEVEDWVVEEGTPNNPTRSPSGAAYIRRIFVDDYEVERYMVLNIRASLAPIRWIRCRPIPVGKGDKMTFSVDFAYDEDNDNNSSAEQLTTIMLYGDDGSQWAFGGVAQSDQELWQWKPYDDTADYVHQTYIRTQYQPNLQDLTKWLTITAEIKPLPVSGDLVIMLYQGAYSNITSMRYTNLNFNYKAFINGSYQKYTGQYNQIDQDLATKRVYREVVRMSDSPKRLFKGALHVQTTWKNIVTGVASIIDDHIILDITFGDISSEFAVGTAIVVTGTVNNNGFYIITASTFNGSSTVLYVEKFLPNTPIVNENSGTFMISQQVFGLAGRAIAPGGSEAHFFSYHQAYAVWNQYNRHFSIFDFQIQGLNSQIDLCDILHNYWIFEDSPFTNEKIFMMLHFDQDHHINEWKGVMMEVYDTTIPKDYDSPLTFKYITG